MLKILVLAAQNNVADARMEWLTCSILRDEKKLSIAAFPSSCSTGSWGRASGLPRRQTAIILASATNWAVMEVLIDQPTTRREKARL
jgi:hypothetical protein